MLYIPITHLRDWSQSMAVKGLLCVCCNSGVSKGSHLGPLILNVFVNDIDRCFLNLNVLLEADNTKK